MQEHQYVIVVDDNELVRDLTKAMLERDGLQVQAAGTPYEALALAAASPHIDLLVTDIVMPGMDGIELADRVVDLHPEATVLFTSGHADERILAPGSVPSGAAFLPKPFKMAELVQKTHDVLESAQILAGPTLGARSLSV